MTLTPKELAEYNIIRSTMVTQLGTNDIGGFELTINQLIGGGSKSRLTLDIPMIDVKES